MKPLHYAFVIAAALVATAASSHSGATHPNPAQNSFASFRATDGAYRDGLFIGHLDRTQGRHHLAAAGRWNNAIDRQSFAVGYEQAYSEVTSN